MKAAHPEITGLELAATRSEQEGCKTIAATEVKEIGEKCDKCGSEMLKRVGKFGPFVACSGYPECRYIKKDPPTSTGVTSLVSW